MKLQKTACLLLAACLAALLFAGCGGGASVPSSSSALPASSVPASSSLPAGGITLTDMTGREVTLDGPATRVVALTPSDCEILYAIGAGDTLVGRGTYCDYPEDVLALPELGSGAETNIEQIIALQPQVVIMPMMSQSVEQVEALDEAGIIVVVSNAQDIAGTYTAIKLMGAITGKDTEATQLVDEMTDAFAEIADKVTKDGSETVYFEVTPLEYGPWTAGANTFMDELAAMLGLTNAFADVDGWAEISEEQVIERNPDYIVTIEMYYGEGPTPVEEIMGRAGWQDIAAVKNGAVFNVDNNEISRPGPRLVNAAQALYALVYEEAGQDAAA